MRLSNNAWSQACNLANSWRIFFTSCIRSASSRSFFALVRSLPIDELKLVTSRPNVRPNSVRVASRISRTAQNHVVVRVREMDAVSAHREKAGRIRSPGAVSRSAALMTSPSMMTRRSFPFKKTGIF